jgi:hypothetical protein
VRACWALLALLVALPAQAQPGGDMRAMLGRPLPTPQLPEGTVNVRVSKQIPINGVPQIEVTAIVVAPGGESRKKVATTNPEGWATFEGLRAGSTFEATATVEGETLKVNKFTLPDKNGTRIMLVAGLAAGGGGAAAQEAAAPEQTFAMGAVTGRAVPQDGLPAGTLEVALVDQGGQPITGRLVQLGEVSSENSVKVEKATSDARGLVRFQGLPTGESTGYAAIIQHENMRLGTEPFRMDPTRGMRAEIRALGRTSDPSVLRFEARSKLILEVGEDSLQMMEQLIFKNLSQKLFDPGPEGLLVPLPDDHEGAREIEGTTPLDIRAGQGVAVRAPIPPNTGAMFYTQIRVGFVIPAGGAPSVSLKQKMPFGLEKPLFLIPGTANLTLSAPGLHSEPDQADAQGNVVKLYSMGDVAPGGTLAVTVNGLPALNRSGRNIAAVICLLLIGGAIAFSPRSRKVVHAQNTAAQLTERRERLFAELVALEQVRKAKRDGSVDLRRQELVTKLETVYRELANTERGQQAPP